MLLVRPRLPTHWGPAHSDPAQDFRQLRLGLRIHRGGPPGTRPGTYLIFSDIPGDARWRWTEAGGHGGWRRARPHLQGQTEMVYEGRRQPGLVCEQVTSCLIPDPAGRLAAGLAAFQLPGEKYLNRPETIGRRAAPRMGPSTSPTPNYGRWARWPVGVARDLRPTTRLPRACSGCRRAAGWAVTPTLLVEQGRSSSSRTGPVLLAGRERSVHQRPPEPQGVSTSRRTGSLVQRADGFTTRWAAPGCPATATRTGMKCGRPRQHLGAPAARRDLVWSPPSGGGAGHHRDARRWPAALVWGW